MSVLGVIKEHPYIAGGAVLGTVVLVFMLSGGSSDTGTAVVQSGSTPDPNQAALIGIQAQAGVRNNEINAQLEALNLAADRDRHTADLAYGVQLNDSNNAADVAMATLSTQQTLGLATISATKDVALGAQGVEIRKMVSDEHITDAINARDITLAGISSARDLELAHTAAKVVADQNALIYSNHQIDAGVRSNELATMERMNTWNANTAYQIAAVQGNFQYATAVALAPYGAQVSIAQSNAQVAVAQANNDHGAITLGPFGYRY
jgi:hypothetical protein